MKPAFTKDVYCWKHKQKIEHGIDKAGTGCLAREQCTNGPHIKNACLGVLSYCMWTDCDECIEKFKCEFGLI